MEWVKKFQDCGLLSANGKVVSYVRRRYPDTHPLIIQFVLDTPQYGSMPFVARIYCVIRNMPPPMCKSCGRSLEHKFNSTTGFPTYCSTKCSNADPDKKANIAETLQEKYGGHHLSTPESQKKRRATNIAKYGDAEPLRTEAIKRKGVETSIAKYGAAHYQSSEIGKARVTSDNINRFGYRYRFNSPDIQREVHDIIYQRYGVRSTAQLPEVIQRRYENNPTLMWRYYGSEHAWQLGHDVHWLVQEHVTNKRTLACITKELGLKTSKSLSRRLTNAGEQILLHVPRVSTGESELFEWIAQRVSDAHGSNRTIIAPRELDIVCPSHSLAIEYCGLYWHSDVHKDPEYHAAKLQQCRLNNYRLFTVFEDEWKNRRKQVEAKILATLGQDPRPISYPRKCVIANVPVDIKRQFFDTNHIQGNGPSSINLGLYDGDVLVACMGFISKGDGIYLLNRYAASRRCPGGFSKLLQHFKRSYQWSKIETFADLRWSAGDLYRKTGFTEEYTIPPDYYWTDGTVRMHKFSMRHAHLKRKLEQYDPTLTEDQNCRNHGLVKIYDCGKIKFSLAQAGV